MSLQKWLWAAIWPLKSLFQPPDTLKVQPQVVLAIYTKNMNSTSANAVYTIISQDWLDSARPTQAMIKDD